MLPLHLHLQLVIRQYDNLNDLCEGRDVFGQEFPAGAIKAQVLLRVQSSYYSTLISLSGALYLMIVTYCELYRWSVPLPLELKLWYVTNSLSLELFTRQHKSTGRVQGSKSPARPHYGGGSSGLLI